MNQILELREKRAKAWDAAKAFLDSKRGADGMHLRAADPAQGGQTQSAVRRKRVQQWKNAMLCRGKPTKGKRSVA